MKSLQYAVPPLPQELGCLKHRRLQLSNGELGSEATVQSGKSEKNREREPTGALDLSPIPTRDRVAYIGIDVAIAKKKRLPVSVCLHRESLPPTILPIRQTFRPPPSGCGNVAILVEKNRRQFATQVLDWISELERSQGLKVCRIGIDASSDYCRDPSGRRPSERALNASGISCYATPTEAEFRQKTQSCREFLKMGGAESRLPNANLLWMLAGFQLFRTLEPHYPCLETYPQAIVRTLHCANGHKSTATGYADQFNAAARILNQSRDKLSRALSTMGYGSRHDRLDAFFSAYVASLPANHREAFGTPPDDAIWVPKV